MKDLMRNTIPDDWGIKELQNCLLNIVLYIHDFCIANDIEYCLMGGSALGAVRHKGFIPWDDDIDIFMTIDDYEKFRKIFAEKGDKEHYYLQERLKSNGKLKSAKLRLNNSLFEEDNAKGLDIHQGVFIDIMLLYDYPNNKLSQKWFLLWNYYLGFKGAANLNVKSRKMLANSVISFVRLFPKRFLVDFALSQIWKYSSAESDYYFHFYIGLPLSHSIYPKRIFREKTLMDFETIQLYVPCCYDEYLRILYGDYMKIPDQNQIKKHQHASFWQLNSNTNIPTLNSFKDELFY